MNSKPFLTIDQQISLLRDERKLIFHDEEAANAALSRYGYYEIINGYKDNFMVNPENDDKGFIQGTTFEHIFAMFDLDKSISQAVLSSLAFFEANLKQAVAYVIAENISEEHAKYIDPNNYSIGDIHTTRTGKSYSDRDILMKEFRKLSFAKQPPIPHYKNDIGNIPPWIMVKRFSLGSTIYWYRLCPSPVRIKIQARLFELEEDILIAADDNLKISQSFGDILSLCLEYRNRCAHGGRVYNYRNRKKQLSFTPFLYPADKNELFGPIVTKSEYQRGIGNSSIGALILGLSRFGNKQPYADLSAWLHLRLTRYLEKYPNDFKYLFDTMELQNSALGVDLVNAFDK